MPSLELPNTGHQVTLKRRHNSWKEAELQEALRSKKGILLIMIHKADQMIMV